MLQFLSVESKQTGTGTGCFLALLSQRKSQESGRTNRAHKRTSGWRGCHTGSEGEGEGETRAMSKARGFQLLQDQIKTSGLHGTAAAAAPHPQERARRIIEELRAKHTFVHSESEFGKPVDCTIGVILTNVRVKFVIPGSPAQRPIAGHRCAGSARAPPL